MRALTVLLAGFTVLATSALAVRAEVNVVVSIKPIHSLVAGVMQGVAEPKLIIDGAGSPHTYAMRPSQAAMLQNADLVFWVGDDLETFLAKPLETLAQRAKAVELGKADGLNKLEVREGVAFERHEHHDDAGDAHPQGKTHAHAAKTNHNHKHDHSHNHDNKAVEAGHDGHDEHGDFDPHLWLDPVNAKTFVGVIAAALAEADPKNAATYDRNAKTMTARLDTLLAEVAAAVRPVQQRGFVVFHDGYQYFETRFGLAASGSVTVSPEVMPGAKRVSELRTKVQTLGVGCIFSEPQFEPKLVATIIEGTPARAGVLDPLGASLQNGPDLYFNLIRNMGASFKTCLATAG